MQLLVSRSQSAVKGMLGGHKGVEFTLFYRLQLTDEEAALVREYRLDDYPVTWRGRGAERMPDDTIRNMVAGRSQTVTDVTTLLSNEQTVVSACDSLPPLFEVVRSFGGEEVIDFPRSDRPTEMLGADHA